MRARPCRRSRQHRHHDGPACGRRPRFTSRRGRRRGPFREFFRHDKQLPCSWRVGLASNERDGRRYRPGPQFDHPNGRHGPASVCSHHLRQRHLWLPSRLGRSTHRRAWGLDHDKGGLFLRDTWAAYRRRRNHDRRAKQPRHHHDRRQRPRHRGRELQCQQHGPYRDQCPRQDRCQRRGRLGRQDRPGRVRRCGPCCRLRQARLPQAYRHDPWSSERRLGR